MTIPNIQTSFKDEELNFEFIVYAYRKLTLGELRLACRIWRSKNKKLNLRNKVIKITSEIGYND